MMQVRRRRFFLSLAAMVALVAAPATACGPIIELEHEGEADDVDPDEFDLDLEDPEPEDPELEDADPE